MIIYETYEIILDGDIIHYHYPKYEYIDYINIIKKLNNIGIFSICIGIRNIDITCSNDKLELLEKIFKKDNIKYSSCNSYYIKILDDDKISEFKNYFLKINRQKKLERLLN